MRILLPFKLFMIFLLFGCQANMNELSFIGDGDYWSAEFVVYQSGARESYKIKLNYQGENLKKIKTFQYYIISKSGKVDYKESNAELNEEGIFVNELLVENSPTTPVGDELILTMEWNDNSESFNLKSRN